MAKYKDINYEQDRLIPISFSKQIRPGTLEYTISYLIDHEIDLSLFESHYKNDQVGRPAYDPAVLLKVILYAYSRGIVSSREIAQNCQENIIFMALSGDSHPHFTTIAGFIADMDHEITAIFRDVLLYCDKMGLIGKDMFAVDGCKRPSNADKRWSGTKKELKHRLLKTENVIKTLVKEHRSRDKCEAKGKSVVDREKKRIEDLKDEVRKVKEWLKKNQDKPGKTGPKKSNITDNESAKMSTSHGVIQGYVGLAVVDDKHQIVVHGEAFGEAQEHGLLPLALEATKDHFSAIGVSRNIYKKVKVTADAGFHSRENLEYLHDEKIDAYIADTRFRKRDDRFSEVDKYKERTRKERRARVGAKRCFGADEFEYDEASGKLICPAGNKLYQNGHHKDLNGYTATRFRGPKSACLNCPLRRQCIRNPDTSETRLVTKFYELIDSQRDSLIEKMKRKIDSVRGRAIYNKRLGTVEPVFGNMETKGLRRFTLRSKIKVNIQWNLFCILHNIEKIHGYGFGYAAI